MFNYTILSFITNDGESEPIGVYLQIDNGDVQYLTINEYNTFIKNRNKNE